MNLFPFGIGIRFFFSGDLDTFVTWILLKSSAHNWRPNMYYFPDRVWFVTLDTLSHWKAPVYAWVTPVETVSDSLYRVSGQIPNLGLEFGTENAPHFGLMPDKMISEVHNDIEEWLSSIRG